MAAFRMIQFIFLVCMASSAFACWNTTLLFTDYPLNGQIVNQQLHNQCIYQLKTASEKCAEFGNHPAPACPFLTQVDSDAAECCTKWKVVQCWLLSATSECSLVQMTLLGTLDSMYSQYVPRIPAKCCPYQPDSPHCGYKVSLINSAAIVFTLLTLGSVLGAFFSYGIRKLIHSGFFQLRSNDSDNVQLRRMDLRPEITAPLPIIQQTNPLNCSQSARSAGQNLSLFGQIADYGLRSSNANVLSPHSARNLGRTNIPPTGQLPLPMITLTSPGSEQNLCILGRPSILQLQPLMRSKSCCVHEATVNMGRHDISRSLNLKRPMTDL